MVKPEGKLRGHVYWDVYSKEFLSVVPPEDGRTAMFLAVDQDAQRVITGSLSKAQVLLLAEDCRRIADTLEE